MVFHRCLFCPWGIFVICALPAMRGWDDSFQFFQRRACLLSIKFRGLGTRLQCLYFWGPYTNLGRAADWIWRLTSPMVNQPWANDPLFSMHVLSATYHLCVKNSNHQFIISQLAEYNRRLYVCTYLTICLCSMCLNNVLANEWYVYQSRCPK